MVDGKVKMSEGEVFKLAKRVKFKVDPKKYILAISRHGRVTIAAVYCEVMDDPVAIGVAKRNPIDKENTEHAVRMAVTRAFRGARELVEVFG